jgi:hypothetical protein
MLTFGFITTPFPISAPKAFNKKTFKPELMLSEFLKKNILTKYQHSCFNLPAPINMLVL